MFRIAETTAPIFLMPINQMGMAMESEMPATVVVPTMLLAAPTRSVAPWPAVVKSRTMPSVRIFWAPRPNVSRAKRGMIQSPDVSPNKGSVIHVDPSLVLMSKMEGGGMKHLRQHLQGFDETRAGSIKKLIPIGQEDFFVLNGLQIFPVGP